MTGPALGSSAYEFTFWQFPVFAVCSVVPSPRFNWSAAFAYRRLQIFIGVQRVNSVSTSLYMDRGSLRLLAGLGDIVARFVLPANAIS